MRPIPKSNTTPAMVSPIMRSSVLIVETYLYGGVVGVVGPTLYLLSQYSVKDKHSGSRLEAL